MCRYRGKRDSLLSLGFRGLTCSRERLLDSSIGGGLVSLYHLLSKRPDSYAHRTFGEKASNPCTQLFSFFLLLHSNPRTPSASSSLTPTPLLLQLRDERKERAALNVRNAKELYGGPSPSSLLPPSSLLTPLLPPLRCRRRRFLILRRLRHRVDRFYRRPRRPRRPPQTPTPHPGPPLRPHRCLRVDRAHHDCLGRAVLALALVESRCRAKGAGRE